ncbi:MAG: hypothetical protein J1E06_05870 [Acutalibacter sp.]|nr:hypothetical protein [Acutalibacter sp.]
MITKNFEPYCDNCLELAPATRLKNWIPGQAPKSPEIEIVCKHAYKCGRIKEHLEKQLKQLKPSDSGKSRLTPEELAICKNIGAKWVSKDVLGHEVDLWEKRPRKIKGGVGAGMYVDGKRIAYLPVHCFPSVQPGDCICVEEEEEKDGIH